MSNKSAKNHEDASRIVRQAIREAMQRLLLGTPVRSDGKLTVKSLADEAGVKRWQLTHKHTDLQDEFRALVSRNGRTPEAFKKTVAENKDLKARAQRLRAELDQAQDELGRYARVVQVLELENAAMESELRKLRHDLVPAPTTIEPN